MKYFFPAIVGIILLCAFYRVQGQNQTVSNGGVTAAVSFPGAGCTYNWTNSNPSIGLPASGTGNISSFTAVNNGSSAVTATITATPTGTGSAFIIGSNISVINTTNNQLVSSQYLPDPGFGIAIDPLGRYLYITNAAIGKVSTLDASTLAVIAYTNIGVDAAPRGIAVTPDGSKIYVTNEYPTKLPAKGTVSVIDAATHNIITTIQVGVSPFGVVVSPDGSRVYVANQSSNNISVIDTRTNGLITNIGVGASGSPNELAITHDGSELYVGKNNNIVAVVSTATNKVITTIATGGDPLSLAITPDDKYVYAANGFEGSVTVIDTKTKLVTATIKVPGGQGGAVVSVTSDGSEAYVVNADGTVTIINTTSNTIVTTLKTPRGASSFGNFITGSTGCAPVTFTITVNPTLPSKITTAGTFTPFGTTYGDPSASQKVTVGAVSLSADLVITAPAGFELSTDNGLFNSNVTISPDPNGLINATPIYARLSATAPAGSYSGNIKLSSNGATEVDLPVTGTVTPAPLVITANSVSKTYGNTLTGSTGSSAFTVSGLKNEETVGSVAIAYGTGAAAGDHPGTYSGSVTASAATGGTFAASNYKITYLPADITINPAELVITAVNQTKVFGAPNPVLTVTYNGFVNNDGPEQLITLPVVYTDAAQASPVGEYRIVVSGASSPDYKISYVPGRLTVYLPFRDVSIPNVFTPNGDNINDYWKIDDLQYFPNCKVEVYNRYGQRLFQSTGYSNAWDGTVNYQPVPPATYYYLIYLGDGSQRRSGYVTVIR